MPAEPSAEQQTKAQDMADKYDNGGFAGFKNDEATAAAAPSQKKKQTWNGPGMQTPAKSGFMQQLTGVVNQGKNLMRSDINARMTAWHDATQHPESASMFLKAGGADDLTDIDDMINTISDGTYDKESRDVLIYDDEDPGQTISEADMDAINKYLRRLTKEQRNDVLSKYLAIDGGDETVTGRNVAHIPGFDADDFEGEVIDASHNIYGQTAPESDYLIGEGMEMVRDGYDREMANRHFDLPDGFEYKNEVMKERQNRPEKKDPEIAKRLREGDFKESATLLGGYLEGLQDRGYITCDQRAFAKAVFGDDTTDAQVMSAAGATAPSDLTAKQYLRMKSSKDERGDFIAPAARAKNLNKGAREVGYNAAFDGSNPGDDFVSFLQDRQRKKGLSQEKFDHAIQAYNAGLDKGIEEQDQMYDRWGDEGDEFTESANGFSKAVFNDDETDAVVEDAAAKEGPDDSEASRIKHMKGTKKERADAIKPVTSGYVDDLINALNVGYDTAHGQVAADVEANLSSYYKDLVDNGYLSPIQYEAAMEDFANGRDAANRPADDDAWNQKRYLQVPNF